MQYLKWFFEDPCGRCSECPKKTTTQEPRTCDIEGMRSECLKLEGAVCKFKIDNAELCHVSCACVSANPPVHYRKPSDS